MELFGTTCRLLSRHKEHSKIVAAHKLCLHLVQSCWTAQWLCYLHTLQCCPALAVCMHACIRFSLCWVWVLVGGGPSWALNVAVSVWPSWAFKRSRLTLWGLVVWSLPHHCGDVRLGHVWWQLWLLLVLLPPTFPANPPPGLVCLCIMAGLGPRCSCASGAAAAHWQVLPWCASPTACGLALEGSHLVGDA